MMRTLLVVSLLALTTLAGCASKDAPAATDDVIFTSPVPLDADGFAAQLVSGWTYEMVRATGDVPVTFEVFLPDAATALEGASVPDQYPTVLLASPYNGAGVGADLRVGYPPYDALFQRLVTRGYAIVVGDSAAMGGSGGCWDFMGPDDQASAVALVEAIAAQPWSNGKIGMHGLSYDAMTQIMAASRVAEHLTTIVPAAGLTHAYAGLYMGGVHYGGGWWSTTAGYTESGLAPPLTFPPDPSHPKTTGYLEGAPEKLPCIAETNLQGNDPTGAYNDFYKARDFRPLAGEVNASVFYIQGFLDGAVKPDNLGTWFESVNTTKKAWLGWWPHTYPTAQVSGREDMYLTIHRWFDHELMGVPNGILDEPAIAVQDSMGRWRHEAAWPPQDAAPLPLYLGADGLGTEPGSGQVTVGSAAAAANAATTLIPGTRLELPAQENDLHISGHPTLKLQVASDRAGGQIIARLVDLDQSGVDLVTQGAFNLLLHDSMDAATPLQPGQMVDVELPLYPTDYFLPAGHRLALELHTTSGGWFTADPHMATLTIAAGEGSVLTLPTIERGADDVFLVACGWPLQQNAECFDREREDRGTA